MLKAWTKETSSGTHHINYNEIDYYRIYPAGTKMLWDGRAGAPGSLGE